MSFYFATYYNPVKWAQDITSIDKSQWLESFFPFLVKCNFKQSNQVLGSSNKNSFKQLAASNRNRGATPTGSSLRVSLPGQRCLRASRCPGVQASRCPRSSHPPAPPLPSLLPWSSEPLMRFYGCPGPSEHSLPASAPLLAVYSLSIF